MQILLEAAGILAYDFEYKGLRQQTSQLLNISLGKGQNNCALDPNSTTPLKRKDPVFLGILSVCNFYPSFSKMSVLMSKVLCIKWFREPLYEIASFVLGGGFLAGSEI